MMYWPGLLLFAAGGWLLYTALRKRKAARAYWQVLVAEGRTAELRTNPKLASIALVMRPIVIGALLVVGLEIVGIYAATDLGRNFSVVDVAGFLFLLVGYGTWFVINTRYRDVPTAR